MGTTSKINIFPSFLSPIYAYAFDNLVEYISTCLRKLIYNRHVFQAVDQKQLLTFCLKMNTPLIKSFFFFETATHKRKPVFFYLRFPLNAGDSYQIKEKIKNKLIRNTRYLELPLPLVLCVSEPTLCSGINVFYLFSRTAHLLPSTLAPSGTSQGPG